MPGRILLCAVLIIALSLPAFPQTTCTSRQIWGISGFAGLNPSGPDDALWFANIAELERTRGGGPPDCSYRWVQDYWYGYLTGGHWYGGCASYALVCGGNQPTAPANAPGETGLGSSCPACGKPISLLNGNVYVQQSDLRVPGLGGGLTLARTWNSLWPQSQSFVQTGLFGPNWRSTYEERIFPGVDGTYKYSRADGSFWSFQVWGT